MRQGPGVGNGMAVREPVGVVAHHAVQLPDDQLRRQGRPALACGNTVVVKPAPIDRSASPSSVGWSTPSCRRAW
jgi:acyl-CoA reductase-like NAD-dependent aldehyde dehydrogenase